MIGIECVRVFVVISLTLLPSSAVGHTGVFRRANIGLAGLFVGLGEILGEL